MSRRAYSEINLHFVWRVKGDAPVLRDDIEKQLHRFLRRRALEEPGMYWHTVGGTDDHVHMVVSIPPTLVISEWIGEMKGASSHYINHEIANRKLLQWQTGYGVVSFGSSNLEWVLDYVANQRAHHRAGRAQARLERTDCDDEGKPAEAG